LLERARDEGGSGCDGPCVTAARQALERRRSTNRAGKRPGTARRGFAQRSSSRCAPSPPLRAPSPDLRSTSPASGRG